MSMHCSTTRISNLIPKRRWMRIFPAFLIVVAAAFALPVGAQELLPVGAQQSLALGAQDGTPREDAPAEASEDAKQAEKKPEEKAEAKPAGPAIALTGAHIISMGPAGEIPQGSIVIRDGKIIAIGAEIEVPADAKTIDLAGRTITPGWIDLHSTLWMTSEAAGDSGSTASLEAIDGIDPFAKNWQEVARQGITSVYVQPASGGILGGFGAVLRVAPANGDLDRLVSKAPAGFQSAIGSGGNAPPRTRISQFDAIKKRLTDAKAYREAWDKYRKYEEEQAKKKTESNETKKENTPNQPGAENRPAPGSDERRSFRGGRGAGPGGNGPGSSGSNGAPPRPETPEKSDEKPGQEPGKTDGSAAATPAKEEEKPPQKPAFDAQKERLVRVLSGEIPLRVEVRFGDDAERLLSLAKEFEISIVLSGLSELGSKTEVVQKAGLPIVLGPWLSGSNPKEAEKRNMTWIESFADYPGRMAIATFDSSPRGSKTLRHQLAVALAAGFPQERALESVTSVPAAILGMSNQIGTLREGSDADLVVFAGNPLDPATPIEWTFSQGESVYSAPMSQPVPPSEIGSSVAADSNAPSLSEQLPGTYAIRTKNLLQSDGSFAPGSMLVRDKMIAEVGGYDLTIAEDIPVFILDQSFITPGLVAAHASLSADRGEDRQSLADVGPGQAADSFDPTHPSIPTLVHGGFLRAGHAGGDLRVIAGPMAEVRLGNKPSIVQGVIAEKMVLAGSARSTGRFPASLAGQQQLVREVLSEKTFDVPFAIPSAATKIMSQLREARQGELLSGKRPVLFYASQDAEIIAAIRLANQYGLKAALVGPNQLDGFADLLASQQIGVVVQPFKSSDYDWLASDIAIASNAGVSFAFAGEDPTAIRATASAAVQAGMSPENALRALTSGGAALVGMSPTAGSLQASAPADFVLWSDSPLNLAARPLAIVVDGAHVDTEHP